MQKILISLQLRHDLHVHRPLWVVATLDRLVKITLVAFSVPANQLSRLGISEVFNALLGTKMKLDPKTLALRIPKTISMRAKAMHMTIARRNTPIAHNNSDLVQRFRQQGPIIPVISRAAHVGTWITLDGFI